MQRPLLFTLLLFALLAQACAAGGGGGGVPYSLEGPALAIAGEQGKVEFSGRMERACMLGQGRLALQSEGRVCAGVLKSALNNAGHIAGTIACNDGRALLFTFRSLGPDQGIGVGRFAGKGASLEEDPLIFYFHPWEEEARRRLEQEKDILLDIISKKEKS